MGKFQGMAQAIADRIRKGPVTAEELPNIMREALGGDFGWFNCFPGEPGAGCEKMAMFISLICKTYAIGLGHLVFRNAINKIVRHVFRDCPDARDVLFITDSWDPVAIHENIANLKEIQNRVHLEIYLIDDLGNVNEKFV